VLVCYGYNVGEVPLPEVKPVRADCKIRHFKTLDDPTSRPPVQISLGCHVADIAQPHVNPNNSDTVESGVRKRFLLTPPKPCKIRLAKFKSFVKTWCSENLTPLKTDSDTSVQAWLDKTNYPLGRREELLRVWESRDGYLLPKDSRVKSFVKDETYPEYKHARAINSRSDAFKCAVGPIFRLIEEEVFKHPAFIKKIPVSERPAYMLDRLFRVGAKYMGADYTAFESHFVREILESCEWVLYDYMTSGLPEHSEFMKRVQDIIGGKNICLFRFFSVSTEARRMSGEMNTSLGNGFTNLMLLLFLFSELGEEVSPVVEGDDSCTSYMNRAPTTKDFADLGFTIKIQTYDNFEEMSFCGIIFDPHDLVNVRKFAR
jgi:hypothetical protein